MAVETPERTSPISALEQERELLAKEPEEVLREAIDGVDVRIALGGEYLNTQNTPVRSEAEKKKAKEEIEALARGTRKIDTAPIAAYSFKKRQDFYKNSPLTFEAQYQNWRTGMIKWLDEVKSGERTAKAIYDDRAAFLTALGIDIAHFSSLSTDQKKDGVKKLYNDFFDGQTNVKKMAELLIGASKEDGEQTVSASLLYRRLRAIYPFFRCCGEEARREVAEQIFIMGFPQADEQDKRLFIDEAQKVVGDISPEEKAILDEIRGIAQQPRQEAETHEPQNLLPAPTRKTPVNRQENRQNEETQTPDQIIAEIEEKLFREYGVSITVPDSYKLLINQGRVTKEEFVESYKKLLSQNSSKPIAVQVGAANMMIKHEGENLLRGG